MTASPSSFANHAVATPQRRAVPSTLSTSMSRRCAQTGLSLVELMVAITITMLIASAIGLMYVSSKTVFRDQDSSTEVRESGFAFMDELSRDIRRAGFYGCYMLGDLPPGIGITNTARLPVSMRNTFPIPTTASGEPRVGPEYAVFGGLASELLQGGGSSVTPVAGSDYLEISFGEPLATLESDMPDGTSPFITSKSVFVRTGQPMLISNCSNMTLFRADNGGVNGAFTKSIDHDTALGDNVPMQSRFMNFPYARGSLILGLNAATYFVGRDSSGNYALYRHDTIAGGGPQPYIANVEDMRVRFLLDTNGATSWVPAQTVRGSNRWRDVKAVRINLLIASNANSQDGAQQYVWQEGRGFVKTSSYYPDKRPRRHFEVTSSIRGRNEIGGA